jgi:LysR family transcriptional activator of nhaA
MSTKKWINYHHLYYFKVIASEGGIAKAAKKLRLGQPTLSTQLKQFEDVLGIELFDRSKRQLSLTDAGHVVLGYANDIFKLGDELLDTLSDHHFAHKFQVQIGISDTVPRQLAYRIFKFASEQRDAFVSLSQGQPDTLLRELRAHQLDFVVSNVSPGLTDSKGLYPKAVAKMPVIICGGPKLAGLKKGFPKSLNGQAFIMPGPLTKLRQDIEHFLRINDIQVNVIAEVQDTGLQKIMATHNDGLIAIAEPASVELVNAKELFPIGTVPDIHEDLLFIAADRKLQNPVAQVVLKNFTI